MKTLVLFYSLSGATRRYARAYAREADADLVEIIETKKRTGLSAFVPGCVQAMRASAVPIVPPTVDWTAYSHVVLAAPVWAGRPAPAINTAAALVPAGTRVTIALISASGKGNADALARALTGRGCEVGDIEQVKGGRAVAE